MLEIKMRRANQSDFDAIAKLLTTEKLPVDDIDTSLKNFFVAESGSEIAGPLV